MIATPAPSGQSASSRTGSNSTEPSEAGQQDFADRVPSRRLDVGHEPPEHVAAAPHPEAAGRATRQGRGRTRPAKIGQARGTWRRGWRAARHSAAPRAPAPAGAAAAGAANAPPRSEAATTAPGGGGRARCRPRVKRARSARPASEPRRPVPRQSTDDTQQRPHHAAPRAAITRPRRRSSRRTVNAGAPAALAREGMGGRGVAGQDHRPADRQPAAGLSSTSPSVAGSRCAVGSSSSSRGASLRKARAIAIALRLPAGEAEAVLADRRVEDPWARLATNSVEPGGMRMAAAISASVASGRARRMFSRSARREQHRPLADPCGQRAPAPAARASAEVGAVQRHPAALGPSRSRAGSR